MKLIYKDFYTLDKGKYKFPFYVITNRIVVDGDFKSSIAKNKPAIPKGTRLKITDMFINLEGDWLKTEYNGFNFSINPEYVSVEKL